MIRSDLIVGEKYNWKGQPERLIYMGCRRYAGDSRGWFQFAKIDQPTVVWSEVLESDLESIEPTAQLAGKKTDLIIMDDLVSQDFSKLEARIIAWNELHPKLHNKAQKKAEKRAKQRLRG